jgi:hypothetical protein
VDQLPPPPSDTPVVLPSQPTPPGGGKRWLVVALVALLAVVGTATAVAVAGGSDAPPDAAVSPSATPLPQPNPPADLKASAGAFRVKLTWRPGTGSGAPADRYDVVRESKTVGHADGDATSFLDDTVVPNEVYDYEVIAVSAEGTRLGASVRTETPGAPPGTAALAGVFNVKVHPTSHSGFSSFSEKDFTAGWRFVPACKEPPCDTQVRDLGRKEFLITLQQKGGVYQGTVSISGLVSCSGHDASSSVTVAIHATRADRVGGTWRVSKFTGTMSEYTSSQLGCTSSSARFDVTGSLTSG